MARNPGGQDIACNAEECIEGLRRHLVDVASEVVRGRCGVIASGEEGKILDMLVHLVLHTRTCLTSGFLKTSPLFSHQ
jgi:hypothetical protein